MPGARGLREQVLPDWAVNEGRPIFGAGCTVEAAAMVLAGMRSPGFRSGERTSGLSFTPIDPGRIGHARDPG